MFFSRLENIRSVRFLASSLLCGTVLLGSGCAIASEKEEKYSEPPSFSGSFLSGMFAKRNGLDKDASQHLNTALSTNPDNVEVQLLTFRLALTSGDMDKAIDIAKKLHEKNNKDPLITLLLAADEVKKGQFAAAKDRLKHFDNKGFNEVLTPILAAWTDIGLGEIKEPVQMDEVISKAQGSPGFLYFQLALMNDIAGFKDEALDNYKKAMGANPQQTPYRVVMALGNFYERTGRTAEAMALYKEYMSQNLASVMGNDTEIFTKAREGEIKPIIANVQDGMAELFSVLASLFYTDASSPESLYYLRLAIHLKPDYPPTQLMLGDVLAEKGEREEADKIYEAIDHTSYYYRQGQIKKAFNLDGMGKTDEAMALLESIAAAHPGDFEPYLSKGDILRDKKKFAEATEAYSESIKRVKTVEKQHWPLFYVRGICYERAGKWELAEKDFLKALELEPDQPEVLNYLGYSWLIMGKNMEKAKKMIETAITARPDDAHIIDSMGWALYSLGEYAGAIEYLEQAIEIKPHDPTINDHLGDAYWRVGRKLEAKFQWQRALTFGPEEEKEVETIKNKIESGLPALKAGDQQVTAQGTPPATEPKKN